MSKNNRTLIAAGALVLLLATVLGAYGTHGVQGTVTAERWSAFQVAVDYQFYHGLGMVACALVAQRFSGSLWLGAAGWILLGGVVAFCGSIYGITFGAPAAISALAPLGGLGMMAGWSCLAVGILRAR